MADVLDTVKANMTDRAELPGMSLMEHLNELRKRLINSVAALFAGFGVAYCFHNHLVQFIQRPLLDVGLKMTMTHPTDALDLFIKTALVVGAIAASPVILYQIWLFIAPGLYSHEKKYVFPFMFFTVSLFLSGAAFAYWWVLPGAMKILILDFGRSFNHMIAVEEYIGFFLAVILGLGITFELPIIIFFLALFGIVDARFLLKHYQYAVLIIFLISAIICPLPDAVSMTLFASPMLVLYFAGVVIAYFVHPNRRNRKVKEAIS
jgi:sec-independent protein translocase protein TatC